jgi:hypothetical protein
MPSEIKLLYYFNFVPSLLITSFNFCGPVVNHHYDRNKKPSYLQHGDYENKSFCSMLCTYDIAMYIFLSVSLIRSRMDPQ